MEHLRRLQVERPLAFWALVGVGVWLGLQLVMSLIGFLLGPFGLPGWLPLVLVLGGLVVIARRQNRSR